MGKLSRELAEDLARQLQQAGWMVWVNMPMGSVLWSPPGTPGDSGKVRGGGIDTHRHPWAEGGAVNGRDFSIKLNAIEIGVLTGVIMQSDERAQMALKPVWEQLIAFKKQFEQEAGVKKEILPGGMLKTTDKDGTVIIRAPFPWEVEGN